MEFVNDLISTLTEEFRIKHIKMTAYHPQGNEQMERANQSVKNILSKIIKKTGDWDMHLPSALFATRSTVNESTKFSPSELIYGRQIRQLLDYNPEKATLIKDEDQIEDHYQIETRRLQIIR